MNTCDDQNLEHLSRYHDGELDEQARMSVEEHLRGCPSCAAYLGRLRSLSRMFDTLELPKLDPAKLEAFAVLPDRQRELVILRLTRQVALAATVVLVTCLSVLASAPPPDSESPAVDPVAMGLIADGPTDPSFQLAEWVLTDLSEGAGQ